MNNSQKYKMLHKESLGVFSYTRLYFWWKKGKVIYDSVGQELRKRKIVSILDLGCGQGDDIFRLNRLYGKKYNLSFTGIDINQDNIKLANSCKELFKKENISFLMGDVTNLKIANNTFDLVICSEVTEHLEFPEKALSEIKRILKYEGLAIITSPNKANPMIKLRKLFIFPRQLDSDKEKIILERDRHLSVKSLKEWIDLFKKIGFKVEKVKRGSLIFGGAQIDSHRFRFVLVLLFDVLLDYLPFAKDWAEQNTFCLRK